MVSIVFASCIAVVSAAVADTNAVAEGEKCQHLAAANVATMKSPDTVAAVADTNAVAKGAKCQRDASGIVGATTPRASTDVGQNVGGVQSNPDTYTTGCGRSELFLKYGWWVALMILIAMAMLTVVMMFGKRFAECRWSVASMAMLVSLVGLITLCSFMWVERVVGDCEQSRKIFRGELKEYRLSKSDAVLEAYDQLSSELSRWFAMFAVLGTIFGLVLPIGGYLLQMREIYRKGKEIGDRIDKNVQEYKGKIVDFERKIDEDRNSLSDVRTIGQELRKTQAKSSLNMMKFVWVEFLHVITSGGYDNRDRDRDIAQPIYRIVEALVFAYKLGDDKVLKDCVADVAKIVGRYQKAVKDKTDLDNRFQEFITSYRICTDSFDAYDLIKTIGKTPTLVTVLKFLNGFGITMFGEVDG